LWIARINSAIIVVVTVGGIELREVASIFDITEIKCASVVIIASLSRVNAHSSSSVARIISASISVVTVFVRGNTSSFGVVTFVVFALDRGASDVETFVTRNHRMITPINAHSRVTCVISARVKIFTGSDGERASSGVYALHQLAVVAWSADSWAIGLATFSRDTVVVSAKVSIIANFSSVNTTISTLASSTSSDLTKVTLVASRRTDASGLTRTKTVASSSTRVARNGDTSSLYERVQNSGEGAKVGNIGVSSGHSCNFRRDGVQFVRLHTSSYSESEYDYSSIVCSSDDSRESVGIDVVESISKHDHYRGHPSSGLLQVSLC
jgi:hypothetical protein